MNRSAAARRYRGVARPGAQRGVALLALLTLIAVIGATFLLDRLGDLPGRSLPRERTASERLQDARAALLGFAVTHPTTPGRMPYPDRAESDSWDGISDCYNGTGNLSDGIVLGQFPYRGNFPAADTGCPSSPEWLVDAVPPLERNEGLWYGVSRNLLWRLQTNDSPQLSWRLIDANSAEAPWPPYPWLQVFDASGNLVSDQVAVVIIHPGEPLQGQSRAWTGTTPPAATEFLETVTIGSHVHDNADADGCPDDNPGCGQDGESFVMHPRTDAFNDRLTYITADELLAAVERRVVADVRVALTQYRNRFGGYPWLSPFRDPAVVDPGAIPQSGWADAGTAGNTLVDSDAAFVGAGVVAGDIVELVSDGSQGTIASVDDGQTLTLTGLTGGVLNAASVGDGYNVRPAINAIIDVREGQLPFADETPFLELYAFNTSFDVEWERPFDDPTAEGMLSAPCTGCVVGSLAPSSNPDAMPPNLDVTPATQADDAVVNAHDAAWGLDGALAIGNRIDGTGDGVCRWTGSERDVVCRGTVDNVDAGYTFTVTDTVPEPDVEHTFDVYRNFTFVLNFAGSVREGVTGNYRTRTVASTNPLPAFPGTTDFYVQVDEYLDSSGTFGPDYLLYSVRFSPTVGANLEFEVSRIYRDLEFGDETFDLADYIHDERWYRYLYLAFSESSVPKPADVTGVAGAGSSGSRLEDAGAGFTTNAVFVRDGDFVRNTTQNWSGFVSTVEDDDTLEVEAVNRADITGFADDGSDATTLVDTSKDFVTLGVAINDRVIKLAGPPGADSEFVVTAVTASSLDINLDVSGDDDDFERFDSYIIQRLSDSTLDWDPGDTYEIWRWRCKSAAAGDAGNPEPDCLRLTVRPYTYPGPTPPALPQQTDLRGVVISAGPEFAGIQDRENVDACGADPDGICTYFEDTNSEPGDDTLIEEVRQAGFNDRIRVLSATSN